MSGGAAFIHDKTGTFEDLCNRDMVDLEPLEEEEDLDLVRDLLMQHVEYTDSPVADAILDRWDASLRHFVKVMPRDYRRVLDQRRAAAEQPAVGQAVEAAW